MIPTDYHCTTCEQLRSKSIAFKLALGIRADGALCNRCSGVPTIHHHHVPLDDRGIPPPPKLTPEEKEEFRAWREARKNKQKEG